MFRLSIPALPALVAGVMLQACDNQTTPPAEDPACKSGCVTMEKDPTAKDDRPRILRGEYKGEPVYVPLDIRGDIAIMEGDIVVARGKESIDSLISALGPGNGSSGGPLAKSSGYVRNNVVPGGARSWPMGVIPFVVGPGFAADMSARIYDAVKRWNSQAAIRFVPRASQTHFITFTQNTNGGCNSSVGRTGGNQIINVDDAGGANGCAGTAGQIMHEMGHAAGLYHEHQRVDNLLDYALVSGTPSNSDTATNFAAKSDGINVGAYDPASLMHYTTSNLTFVSAAGNPYTIRVTMSDGSSVTARNDLSAGDIAALHFLHSGHPGVDRIFNREINPNDLVLLYNQDLLGYVITYTPSTGSARLSRWNPMSGSWQQLSILGVGFGHTRLQFIDSPAPFSGRRFLVYNANTGAYRVHSVSQNLVIGPVIASGTWETGWSEFHYFTASGNFYQMSLKVGTAGQNNNVLSVHLADGNGARQSQVFQIPASPWDAVAPFAFGPPGGGNQTLVVLRKSMPSGQTRVMRINANGTFGAQAGVDRNILAGSRHMVAYVSYGSVPTLAMFPSTRRSLHFFEIGMNGVRYDGAFVRKDLVARPASKNLAMGGVVGAVKPWVVSINDAGTNFYAHEVYPFQ